MKVKELIAKLQEFHDNLETDLVEVESLIKKLITKDCYKNNIYFKDIADLNISVRTYNCLKNEGILTIGHLIATNEHELKRIANFGKQCLKELKFSLSLFGLELGVRLPKDAMAALGIERQDQRYSEYYKGQGWYIIKI
jgi:DNA-directed RNA polymerase alpha subunit